MYDFFWEQMKKIKVNEQLIRESNVSMLSLGTKKYVIQNVLYKAGLDTNSKEYINPDIWTFFWFSNIDISQIGSPLNCKDS